MNPDTCGGYEPAPSAGVYYRRRTLPDGAWSKAIPFGKTRRPPPGLPGRRWRAPCHRLERDLGTHRVHQVDAGPVVSTRHGIDADGDVSLRVGDDGRARVAYWGGGSLRYGTFDGSGFSTSKVANGPTDRPAMLVLGARNQPHVVYTIVPPIEGCGTSEPTSRTGTYYATLVNGTGPRSGSRKGRTSVDCGRSRDRPRPCPRRERAAHEEPQQRLGLGTAARRGRKPGDEAGPGRRGPSRRVSPLEPRRRDRRVVRHHDSVTPGRSRRVIRRCKRIERAPATPRPFLLFGRSGIDQRGGRAGRNRTDTRASTIKPPTTMSSRPSRPPGVAARQCRSAAPLPVLPRTPALSGPRVGGAPQARSPRYPSRHQSSATRRRHTRSSPVHQTRSPTVRPVMFALS